MLAAPKSDVVNDDYNRARHIFAVFTTCAIFTLILAGALVTSNDAAPSVPDWPTSFGSIYKIPPMVGGPIRAWPSQELKVCLCSLFRSAQPCGMCLDECRYNIYNRQHYERDKEGARNPGGSGVPGSAPYLRSALSRSCPVLEIRGYIANPIQCAPNPTRRACRTTVW